MGKSAWIFPLVVLALVSGVLGGWVRLGWMALPMPGISSAHGMLMTGSFMGSLISLERSVTMKSKWWLLVPLISVLSAPLFWIGLGNWGMWGLVMASAGMVLMLYFQTMRFKQLENGVMLMGALCWLVGNLLVQQSMFVPMGTGWWIGFILFTILGERLEFGKFLPNPSWSRPLLLLLMGLFWVGLLLPFHGQGQQWMGSSALGMGLWLLRFDMARRSFRKQGQHRYNGLGLMVGYGWLLMFGLVLVFLPSHSFYYDLLLHSFFLGFAFSMIWAHAPIILPMLFRRAGSLYHPLLWYGWGMFQLSLLGRIGMSYLKLEEWRVWMAVANGFVIILMFAQMAILLFSEVKGRKEKQLFH